MRRLLEVYGWELDRIRGSHHTFVRGGQRYTLPHRRPTLLAHYVRDVLALTAGEDNGED